jgi:tRNA dimethylallyltransferase
MSLPMLPSPPHPPPAVFLMGPTASGKTDLAMYLLQHLPFEIISVDSAQVYRHLDIGTAKPSVEELRQAPHRLIDIVEPDQAYSAAEFRRDALETMAQISEAGRIPLLVGGTGLYFRALLYGLSELPAADPGLRARLEQEARLRGWADMHRRLAEVDPAAARRIHPNDPQRIQRALEVYELTGRPLSEQQRGATEPTLPYRVLKLARAPRDRELLRERIARRFDRMLERGLEGEVRGLLARGLTPAASAMRSVGYRQVLNYLLGEWDYATMRERGIIATRQLAKRQLTWLRGEAGVHWLHDEDGDVNERALSLVRRWLALPDDKAESEGQVY